MPNVSFCVFFVFELIYKLFGNNNLVWKLQFCYVGHLVEVSLSLSIVFYYCLFCKPRGVVVINGYYFVWTKIRKYIQNSFV